LLVVFVAIVGVVSAVFTPVCPTVAFSVAAGSGANTLSLQSFPDNSTITVRQACPYVFNINAGGAHFHIKTSASGTGNTNDVTVTSGTNGATAGSITWTPSTTGTFFYSTGVVSGTAGTFIVVANNASCAQYCSDYRLACTSEYDSQAQCETACALMPDVPSYTYDGATPSNSRQCRMEQANCAASTCGETPTFGTLCTNANFVGGYDFSLSQNGLCHTPNKYWESYCEAALSACTGNSNLYTNSAECVSFSQSIQIQPGANADSIQCRITGVLTALTNPTTGCPAASASGGGVCGTKCDVLCYNINTFGTCVDSTCAGDCATTYSSLPTGNLQGQPAFPSLNCYIYNSFQAAITGDVTYCSFSTVCPVPSSSSPTPSSSRVPSSSASVAASSSAEGGGSSAASVQVGVVGLAAIVLSVLALLL